MQALVTVGLGRGNKIFNTPGERLKMFMDNAQRRVTVGNGFGGSGTGGYSGDGGQASAAEINPLGISFDSFDN